MHVWPSSERITQTTHRWFENDRKRHSPKTHHWDGVFEGWCPLCGYPKMMRTHSNALVAKQVADLKCQQLWQLHFTTLGIVCNAVFSVPWPILQSDQLYLETSWSVKLTKLPSLYIWKITAACLKYAFLTISAFLRALHNKSVVPNMLRVLKYARPQNWQA